jgi:hypothetical protein
MHGTVFLRKGSALPNAVSFLQEPFCEGWLSAPETTAHVLDLLIRRASWHFMWIADLTISVSIGRTEEAASRKAIRSCLGKIQQQFNTAELGMLRVKQYPGFFVARASFHPRQIQLHPSLGLVDEMILREIRAH